MLSNILDRISFWALFCVIVLLPIFFLPFTKIPIETAKGFLLVIGLAISIIFWTAARFSDGKIVLPRSSILVSGFGIAIAFLLSALFSPVARVSFFGTMFDFGTFHSILAGFLLMFICGVTLRDLKKIKIVLLGFVLSSLFLILFQIFHIFLPNLLSLGILAGKTSNILGSWNTLGLFAGLFTITSLFIIEFFRISKLNKLLLSISILFSIFLIAITNFSLIWIILGSFTLLIFIFKISLTSVPHTAEGGKRVFPILSFLIVMISLLFFITGPSIGQFLPNHFNISNTEVRPSFGTTMTIAKSVLSKNPVLGAGPNRFSEMWDMYKPEVINSTYLWNSSFNQGSGLIPTFAITTGALGIIAWIIFLVLIVLNGFKSFFSSIKKGVSEGFILAFFFVLSLYLFTVSFFYPAGIVVFFLALAFLGIFIGLYANSREKGEITISFLEDPRKSFFSILFLVFIILVSATAGFIYVERFISIVYFQKTISAQTVPLAELNINKAVSLYSNDFYLRTYSQVYVVKMNSLINKGSSLTEADKNDLKDSIEQSTGAAKLATIYDKTNYINFSTLGSTYELVAPLGVTDAYNNAVDAYKTASALNPLNPSLKLSLAHVYLLEGKTQEAKDYANQALTLKGDYVDALVVLSQIAKSEGNTTDALSYAQAALSLLPQNTTLSQYVNSLKNFNIVPNTPVTTEKTTNKTVDTSKDKKTKNN